MKQSEAALGLDALEQRHRELKDTIARLERRAYLTPSEQHEVANLKKQKLSAKDSIEASRRK
jgi:uncharacterized protein YdcH (DUF465 family)